MAYRQRLARIRLALGLKASTGHFLTSAHNEYREKEPKLLQNEIDDRRERMQRVRVGLTGLAVVLLLVLLATVVFQGVQGNTAPTPAEVIAKDKSDNEPLSDLGIVPRAPDNTVTPAKPAKTPAPQ
jgi:hypothetical protein